ncbi:MAG: methyl-accepting chemotaxis protein [Desulfobacterales bacterium]
MKKIRDISIGSRLTLGFSVIIGFMLIIGVTGFLSTNIIQKNLDEIFRIRLPGIAYLLEADRDLHQLLVAERSMIFCNTASDNFQKFLKDYKENSHQSDERWQKYKILADTEAEKAVIPQYDKAREQWAQVSEKVVEGRLEDTREGRRMSIDLTLGEAGEKFSDMRKYLDDLTEINLKNAEEASKSASRTYTNMCIILLTVTVIALFAAGFFAKNISHSITAPLQKAVTVSNRLAEGNFSQTIEPEGKDETARLLTAMKDMVEKIGNVIKETDQLILSVQEGHLDTRGSAEGFSGDWRRLLVQINDLIEAFIRPIHMTAHHIDRVAKGDIPETVTEDCKGDFDKIRNNLNTMSDNLRRFAVNVQEAAERVATGSEQLSSTASQISQGTSQQAAGIEQISASVEEMTGQVNQNADNAKETAAIAKKSAEEAQKGRESVQKTIQAMRSISEKTVVIEEIARETNMLALNAAIEAARAGTEGKGFAVVAEEVRKLATSSKKAANTISSLSASSLQLAEDTGQMLEGMVTGIQKTSELIEEISLSCSEQADGIAQISKAIQQLDQVIQLNAASTEEMASASEDFSSQAERLRTEVSFFRLSGSALFPAEQNRNKNSFRQMKSAQVHKDKNEKKAEPPAASEKQVFIELADKDEHGENDEFERY